jgi:hypothetical protein
MRHGILSLAAVLALAGCVTSGGADYQPQAGQWTVAQDSALRAQLDAVQERTDAVGACVGIASIRSVARGGRYQDPRFEAPCRCALRQVNASLSDDDVRFLLDTEMLRAVELADRSRADAVRTKMDLAWDRATSACGLPPGR